MGPEFHIQLLDKGGEEKQKHWGKNKNKGRIKRGTFKPY